MSDLAARVAPEVDRLVLGINRSVGPRHGRVLMAVARELGLDSLKLIPHFVDFWLEGPLAKDIAVARLPYAAEGSVLDRLDRFVSLGLLSETAGGFQPTQRFRPLLVASVAAREDVVASTWAGLDDRIAAIQPLVERVTEAVTESRPVAHAHRKLTAASDPSARLYDRLVTMRYIRQHDHVEAWRSRGLTAAEITLLTALWHGETMTEGAPGWYALAGRGLVSGGRLTAAGRTARDEIESDTNRKGERTLSVLGDADGEHLVELLGHLPDSIQ